MAVSTTPVAKQIQAEREQFSYIFPYSVRCSNEKCGVKPYTEYSSTEQEAIDAWNRRIDNE